MDTVKRKYELTYILSGSLTDSEVAQLKTKVEQILAKFNAQILKNEDWGRRPLAYTIKKDGKKQTEGCYTHLVFSLEPSKAPVLEREVYLSNVVMRHLMVVSEETEEETASE
jgi:small subunit ribosomal protein S6